MKKNVTPILLIAFVMAIVCTAVFYTLVAGKLGAPAQASATAGWLVASRDIARGTTVSALDLKTVSSPDPAPEEALRLPSQADGLTAVSDIPAGEPIRSSRLASRHGAGGLGIPSGMRAISVQVHDSSGVVGLLKPGMRVDVQAVYSRSSAPQDAEIRTVLENIEVLKINPVAEPAPGRPALPVATLLVTPAEADTVGLADAVARVRLVLRNPLDQEKVPRTSLGVSGLMRNGAVVLSATPRIALARPAAIAPPNPAPSALSLATNAADPAACNPPKTGASSQ